jgi:hypothetical protein
LFRLFTSHDGSPHRKQSYFKEGRGKPIAAPSTNRREELLAKKLKDQGSLALPCGGELRLLDYQLPLKAVRRDKIGKVDLIGVAQGRLALVELKTEDSVENPRVGLLELLGYWAVVRGNIEPINQELSRLQAGQHAGRVGF